jgi:signal transduction histidine kinase
MDDHFAFLRKVPLFANLSAPDLEAICREVDELQLARGEVLFEEGSLGQQAFVIKEGQVEIFKTSNGQEVQLAVRQPGEVVGEMALLEAVPRTASGRALTDCRLVAIRYGQLDHLLNTSPAAARTMLHTITARLRSTEVLLRQSEKMAQLGRFTAGIAHELNNPAAAIQRAAGQLKAALRNLQVAEGQLLAMQLPAEHVRLMQAFAGPGRSPAGATAGRDSVGRADREAEVETGLEGRGFQEAWNLAPDLVWQGLELHDLQSLAAQLTPGALAPALAWLAAGAKLFRLVDEIGVATGHTTQIVSALKTYTYLDQAPVQEVDVQAGLENALVILRHKVKSGVVIQREFAPGLPRIQAYGSELNQVWTNLIDNAIDAVDGNGQIVLRTYLKDSTIVVEVEDNGPGIPDGLQSSLFSPFFTTKPVGQGTGLGLNISYAIVRKHGGDIKVFSRPGATCFQVWLPVNFDRSRQDPPR